MPVLSLTGKYFAHGYDLFVAISLLPFLKREGTLTCFDQISPINSIGHDQFATSQLLTKENAYS